MSEFDELLEDQLRDPDFRKEYEKHSLERSIVKAFCKLRREKGLSQKMIADYTGIHQPDISRFEQGKLNPTLKQLQRLANAINCDLDIRFVPRS